MKHLLETNNDILETFYEDIRSFVLEQVTPINLNQKSIKFIHTAQIGDLLSKFIYFRKRYPVGKYKVYISENMCSSSKYCKYKKQIWHIKKLLEEGRDIKDFLHNDINDFLFHDNLLQDWGIIHIHLWPRGSRKNKDNDILYAIQIEDSILFLKIDTHKYFLQKELLEILYQNVPNFLCFFPIPGDDFTEKEIESLRNKGIGYAINMGEKSFCGGMNYFLYLIGSVQILENLKKLSELIFLNIHQIKEAIKKQIQYLGKLDFHLRIDSINKKIFIYEENSNTEIRLEENNIITKLTNCFLNLHMF